MALNAHPTAGSSSSKLDDAWVADRIPQSSLAPSQRTNKKQVPRKTLDKQFTEEMAEVLWDYREATKSMTRAEAEVCTAMARYQSAMQEQKRAAEVQSKAREGAMCCKQMFGHPSPT